MLTTRAIISTDPTASTTPKPRASPGIILPAGKGRAAVRRMIASISRSYHMLIAPAAPAPTAMHNTATAASTGCRCPGAMASPTNPVNTTSDMTRGFRISTKSPTPAADEPVKLSAAAGRVSDNSVTKTRLLRNHRQLVITVERRRGRELPLERRGAVAPIIGPDTAAEEQRVQYNKDKEQG